MNSIKKKCDFILYKDGKVTTLEKALKYNIKVVDPIWIVNSILEKNLQPYEKYLIEVRLSDILLRKRKYDNLNKSESQERSSSQHKNKKQKEENSNSVRKSIKKFF